MTFVMETATLQMEAKIVDMVYAAVRCLKIAISQD